MKVVLQRALSASVVIDGKLTSEIGQGILVLVGIENTDDENDIKWLAEKIVNIRIMADGAGIMNLSVKDTDGELMIVSQFTLHALTKKGNRPSYMNAAKPEIAVPIYEKFIAEVEVVLGKKVKTGIFGADMKVTLCNDGPVTIVIDTKNRA